jgi:hypothetical protein
MNKDTKERRMHRTITPEGIICDIAEGTTYAALEALKKSLDAKISLRAEKAKRDTPPRLKPLKSR